jgi:S-adenosylmethionine/arginine decarboxylase-like enzyme
MFGVDDIIYHPRKLKKAFIEALEADDFGVRKVLYDKFDNGAVTIMASLAESDAKLSTYLEKDMARFTLESCRGPDDGLIAHDYLIAQLKPIEENFTHFRIPMDIQAQRRFKKEGCLYTPEYRCYDGEAFTPSRRS